MRHLPHYSFQFPKVQFRGDILESLLPLGPTFNSQRSNSEYRCYRSKRQPRFFQFPKVQFRAGSLQRAYHSLTAFNSQRSNSEKGSTTHFPDLDKLSIPKGPIQSRSGGATWPTKSLSIPKGPIQSEAARMQTIENQAFQFPKVQFRGNRLSCSRSESDLSIPKGPIQSVAASHPGVILPPFNSQRSNSENCT